MRVLPLRLHLILDPDVARLKMGEGIQIHSARSTGSARQGGCAAGINAADNPRAGGPPLASRRSEAPHHAMPSPGRETPGDEGTSSSSTSTYDLLHTEKGFQRFENWYQSVLKAGHGLSHPTLPSRDLGALWPQALCTPGALHQHAFMELIRCVADAPDGKLMDFFDIMDCDALGAISLQQVYLSMCIVAATGSRQLLKLLHMHSTQLFGILCRGCCLYAAPERVTWCHMIKFLRLVGATVMHISDVSEEFCVLPHSQLSYEEFLPISFAVFEQLDRGPDPCENAVTVLYDPEQDAAIKSKTCAIL